MGHRLKATSLLIAMTLAACSPYPSPTPTATAIPTATPTQVPTKAPSTPIASIEPLPNLAGLVYISDETVWQISQDGKPLRLLDYFRGSDAEISYDTKRLLFVEENRLWVADLITGERHAITDGSREPCCAHWGTGRSDWAFYGQGAAEHKVPMPSAVTMTVAYLDRDSLQVRDEKRFPAVEPYASLSPDGLAFAYDDGKTGWIHRWGQGARPFDVTHYGLSLPDNARVISPAWSPNGNRIAWVISGFMSGKRQTGLALFDLNNKTAHWLIQYLSVNWGEFDVRWSPNGKWLAFLPGDVAFAEDGGLWIFSTEGTEKYQEHRARSIRGGWSWDSQHIIWGYKDFTGYLKASYWRTEGLMPVIERGWLVGWTMPR